VVKDAHSNVITASLPMLVIVLVATVVSTTIFAIGNSCERMPTAGK
jgi:hypothetical protein